MQLLPYDYFGDHSDEQTGLIHLADTINALRTEADVTTFLFDNGDFIQGNPLADYLACKSSPATIHPMIAAMNMLEYDAVTLGNHEFNYGLQFLRSVLADTDFPVTCANIKHLRGAALAEPFVIMDRDLRCSDGQYRKLRLGVVGFVTPQIMAWDKAQLAGQLTTTDIVDAAQDVVPKIQAAGADAIVALCHSGIGATVHSNRMENAAVPLAAIPGIDVILTGHTHEVFPGNNRLPSDAVNPDAGTLHGKPAVMAGFYGNRLGVVDLELDWSGASWQIKSQAVRLARGERADQQPSTLQITLGNLVASSHKATLTYIRQPIAETRVPIHSYFATILPDLTQQLLAKAQQQSICAAIADGPCADLPVLAATAPFRTGGRAGPGHYIDIAPGALTLRDAAAIYPFSNTLCAIRRTGAELRSWLERAASHFAQIASGAHDQPLIDIHSAAYNCDTLFGLTYEADLSQPARFGPDGTCDNPGASRICNQRYNRQPVKDDDRFIVATNSYRTNGGGGFCGIPAGDIIHTTTSTTRDLLIDYLRNTGVVNDTAKPTWHFSAMQDTSATFQSAPAARHHLTDGVTHLGDGQDGFDLYRFTF